MKYRRYRLVLHDVDDKRLWSEYLEVLTAVDLIPGNGHRLEVWPLGGGVTLSLERVKDASTVQQEDRAPGVEETGPAQVAGEETERGDAVADAALQTAAVESHKTVGHAFGCLCPP
jgi:hypothetical protein